MGLRNSVVKREGGSWSSAAAKGEKSDVQKSYCRPNSNIVLFNLPGLGHPPWRALLSIYHVQPVI